MATSLTLQQCFLSRFVLERYFNMIANASFRLDDANVCNEQTNESRDQQQSS